MTAAIQDLQIVKLGTEELPPPPLLSLPIEANKLIYGGTIVCSNAAGNAVSAADSTAIFAWGRCERQVNNLATNVPYGAAGSQQVGIRPGVYYLNQDGGITAANVGQSCYLVDDNTVSLSAAGTAGVRPFAGIIQPPGLGQAGLTFQGGTNTQVPVYIGGAPTSGMILKYTVALPLASLQALTSGAAFAVGFPLPAGARLTNAEVNVLTALSGGGLSAATMTVQGGTDAAGSIIASSSVFTGALPVIATPGSNPYAARGAQQLRATITATGAALSAITAGSLTVDFFYTIAP